MKTLKEYRKPITDNPPTMSATLGRYYIDIADPETEQLIKIAGPFTYVEDARAYRDDALDFLSYDYDIYHRNTPNPAFNRQAYDDYNAAIAEADYRYFNAYLPQETGLTPEKIKELDQIADEHRLDITTVLNLYLMDR